MAQRATQESVGEKPPERRRRAPAGFNEQRILEVAVREFSRKGLAGARVDEIARRAGVNKQLLYYYFKSKEGLYNAVLATIVDASKDAYEQMREVVGNGSYSDGVILRASAKWWKRWQPWRRLWLWEALERSATKIVREEERSVAWERGVSLLREAQERGEIDNRLDPAMLMLAIEGILEYPHLLPQNTKLITGALPTDEEFSERYITFLRQLFDLLQPQSSARATSRRRTEGAR